MDASGKFVAVGAEPSLEEVLRDPIVRLLMARDRVDECELWRYLHHTDGDEVCCSAA